MPSGKQSKRLRSAAAEAPASPVARRLSPRVLALLAAAVVLVVAAVVLATGRHGGGSGGAVAGPLPGAPEVERLLHGIPQRENVLGRAAAPATMVVYVDLQCPYCRQFETEAM